MKTNIKQTSVIIKSIGALELDKRRKCTKRIIKFSDLYDGKEYSLCILNKHKNAVRFEKLNIGTRLSHVVVYKENGKNYVDGNSNFKLIRATPLF